MSPVPGLVTAHDVTQAVLEALGSYLPVALLRVSPAGVTLKAPAAYSRPTVAAARLDASNLPAVVVSPTETGPTAVNDADGTIALAFSIDIAFLIRSESGTYEDTMRDAALYAAAIYTVMNERGDLDGFARGTYGLDESYDEADPTAGRTLAEGHVTCEVVVDDARRRQIRFTDPASTDGIASTTEVTVLPV